MNNKIYLYGGISDQNEVLETMEVFDAQTYKMSEVKYRLDARAAGRQGHAAIAVDKFNMLVIGGTKEVNLLDPPQMPARELVYSFDLEASTWHPKADLMQRPGGEPAPWNLVYHSLFKIDTQNVGVLWYDTIQDQVTDDGLKGIGCQRVMRTSIYNMVSNTWKSIRLISCEHNKEPIYRFGSTVIPIFDKHVAIREQVEMVNKV